jgi:kynureninase
VSEPIRATASPPSPRELPDPRALAGHYARFRVGERLLLTGHSHQAWPDVAFEGQQQAWLDAAEHVDEKWERAFAVADRVRAGWRGLLRDPAGRGEIALGQSTLELVGRLLSALPLRERPRLVTTDGEFHTLRRLADRLAEEGLEVVRVPARPVATLAERLAAQVTDRTALVAVSSVLYETAEIVPQLDAVAGACAQHGAELLVDAYHHLNVVPFDVRALGLERAFITGGGYKYCQLGEGNAFLRFPADTALRPVLTGWFSEFTAKEEKPTDGRVPYGPGPARFAGATYDPTSHYRAAAVFDFFEREGLTPELLRAVSQRQMHLLVELCGEWPIPYRVQFPRPRAELEGLAGFLALRTPLAPMLVRLLRERRVFVDHRGEILRIGPAPYVRDDQLAEAVTRLATLLAEG